MAGSGLTPNAVLTRRVLVLTAVAIAFLLVLAWGSSVYGGDLVLAIEAANTIERAQSHDARGDVSAAASEYYRLLELRPHDTRVLAALIELQLRQGLNDEALEGAERLVSLSETDNRPRDLSLYGNALLAKGAMPGASDAYEDALTLQPNFPDALYGFALHAALSGKPNEARQFFDLLQAAGTDAASREYARSVRHGEAFARRYRSGDDPGLSNAEAAALMEWHLKHGRLKEASHLLDSHPHVRASGARGLALRALSRLASEAAQ